MKIHAALFSLALSATSLAAVTNLPPTAVADTVVTRVEKRPFTLTNLRANDTDPEGNPLNIIDVTQGAHGIVTRTGNSVTYDPRRTFNGTDNFTYTISDGQGNTAVGNVSLRNPFLINKGDYAAPISGVTPTAANSGYLFVSTSFNGAFTAQIRFAGETFKFKGRFGLDGTFTGDLVRRSGARFQFTMQFPIGPVGPLIVANPFGTITNALIIAGPQAITGSIGPVGQLTAFSAPRNLFSASNPAPRFGSYTVSLPPNAGATLPQGNGFGILEIGRSGRASLVGKLGDDRSYSSGVFLNANGTLPIYAALYRIPGSLFGTATFSTVGAFTKLEGPLNWFKPPTPGTVFFKNGFLTTIAMKGSSYVPPAVSQKALIVPATSPNATFKVSAGELRPGVVRTSRFTLGTRPAAGAYAATFQLPDALKTSLRINAGTGFFSGVFSDPANRGARRTYSGALIQMDNAGVGVFAGKAKTGKIDLTPDAVPVP